jgi:hypothetical protein
MQNMKNRNASIATLYRRKKGIKVLSVHGATYNRLRELGKTPDSFDKIISRLIDEHYARNNSLLTGSQEATNHRNQQQQTQSSTTERVPER